MVLTLIQSISGFPAAILDSGNVVKTGLKVPSCSQFILKKSRKRAHNLIPSGLEMAAK